VALRRIAQAADRRLGSDRITTCVELVSLVAEGRIRHPWSLRRIDAHLVGTVGAARDCRGADVFPWPRVVWTCLAGPALLTVAAIAAGMAAGPTPTDASAITQPAVALRNVEVRLDYPSYTGLPTLTVAAGSGAFEALPGTRVEVRAETAIPLTSVSFQVGEGPWLEGDVEDGTDVVVRFVVGSERVYRIVATPAEGREPLRSGPLRIAQRIDEPPRVELIDPPDDEVALDVGEALALQAEVDDDFGVRDIEGVVRRGEDVVARIPLLSEGGVQSAATVALRWTVPTDIGGGPLEVSVRATDNDEVGGPKATEAGPVRVRVLTEADRQQRVLDAQVALFEVAIAALGDHLMWIDDPVDERRARAHERMSELLDSARELKDAYQQAPRPEATAYATIGAVVGDLTRSWDRLRDRGADPGDLLARHVRNLERAVLALDRQLVSARSLALAEASREAAEAVQRLEEALAHGDAAAIDRALEELANAMAEVHRIMAQMADSPTLDVANIQQSDGVMDLADRLHSLLAEGRTEEARQLLQQGASTLAGMAAGGPAGMSRQQLDALLAEVEELAGRQRAANAEMAGLAERYGDAVFPEGVGALADRLGDLDDRVSRLGEAAMDARMSSATEHRIERDRQHLQQARDALARGDLDGAIRGVALGDSELLDLLDLAEIFHRAGATGMEDYGAWRTEAAAVEGEHLGLIEGLLDAERDRREARAAAALPAVDTAARQRAIAVDVGAFAAELSTQNDPFAGGEVPRALLEAAEQLMRAAASDLDVGRIARAHDGGDEALQHLQRVQDELQRAGEAASGAMALGATPGWSYFETRWGAGGVEIPPPDPAIRLEELRRLALEAAAEDAPPAYEALNGAYYEELVR